MNKFFSTLTSGEMVRIISSAEATVFYAAPGLQTEVAA